MAKPKRIVVLVHGWSVRNTDTFGGLPARLKLEAQRARDLALDVRQIWLSRYVSFQNQITIPDLARAFQAELEHALGGRLAQGQRIVCIAHSTGAVVVRAWLQHFYIGARNRNPPISHLIMLAPANFGAALVNVGLANPSRLRTWFDGVEVGSGILDWLEIGSAQSLALNREWLAAGADCIGPHGVFPFVLTGQTCDTQRYDFLNSYTGETGSDGVVRVASANLNYTCIRLEQPPPQQQAPQGFRAALLRMRAPRVSPAVPMAIIPGVCHSEARMGILRSIPPDNTPHPTVDAILECLRVRTLDEYATLYDRFRVQSAEVQQRERVRMRSGVPRIEDACAMLVFRVRDDQGNAIRDFDIVLGAGRNNDPNALPPGFFIDRQRNHGDRGVLVYYLNAERMRGGPALVLKGRELRAALPGCGALGLYVNPYPQTGMVHYLPASLPASARNLENFVQPNQTTIVDIVLRRVVHAGIYRLTRTTAAQNFTGQAPGQPID